MNSMCDKCLLQNKNKHIFSEIIIDIVWLILWIALVV